MAENDGWGMIIPCYSNTYDFLVHPDQVCAFTTDLFLPNFRIKYQPYYIKLLTWPCSHDKVCAI